MSTYCAIHIQANDKQSFVSKIEQYLALNHRGRVVQTRTADTLGPLYGDEFICSEQQQPTKFAVVTDQPGWFTVHYNSFLPLRELAADISRTLHALAVVVLAQSASSAYHVGIWREGAHLRTLEFADGEWIRKEGSAFPFERHPLDTNLADEGEEPCYSFRRDDVIEYCEHLGLRLWQPPTDKEEWTIIKV